MSRLDCELVSRGLAKSRAKAKELIENGNVAVNGKQTVKPSADVIESDEICITGGELKYVGRAGLKLECAAMSFGIDFRGKICADIGASTGGFTDYMLQNGALRVYAVDVGHGQLHQSLCGDIRVINMEGVNVKLLGVGFFPEPIDIMTADLSFISLKTALPFMLSDLEIGTKLVLLIKPQFEAGIKAVGKGGIVKKKADHIRVLKEVCGAVSQSCAVLGLCPSPIKGGSGNIEYLLYAEYVGDVRPFDADFGKIAEKAFQLH